MQFGVTSEGKPQEHGDGERGACFPSCLPYFLPCLVYSANQCYWPALSYLFTLQVGWTHSFFRHKSQPPKTITDSVAASINKRFATGCSGEFVRGKRVASTRGVVRRDPWRFRTLSLFELLFERLGITNAPAHARTSVFEPQVHVWYGEAEPDTAASVMCRSSLRPRGGLRVFEWGSRG